MKLTFLIVCLLLSTTLLMMVSSHVYYSPKTKTYKIKNALKVGASLTVHGSVNYKTSSNTSSVEEFKQLSEHFKYPLQEMNTFMKQQRIKWTDPVPYQTGSNPGYRRSHRMIAYQHYLLVMLGYKDPTLYHNSMYSFNTIANSWHLISATADGTLHPRLRFGAVYAEDKDLIIIQGGVPNCCLASTYNADHFRCNFTAPSTMNCAKYPQDYNLQCQRHAYAYAAGTYYTWGGNCHQNAQFIKKTNVETGVTTTHYLSPTYMRNGASMAYYNGFLYVGPGDARQEFFKMDVSNFGVSTYGTAGFINEYAHVFNKGVWTIIGGIQNGITTLTTVKVFNTNTNSMNADVASVVPAMSESHAVFVGSAIYVYGGITNTGSVRSTLAKITGTTYANYQTYVV